MGKQVDQWVQQLNDLMVLIRRPFAFRVHQAIRSYVANYPDQSEDGAKTAVADQIEQKILPKFRGLDPADQGAVQALTRLTALLGELGDSQLVHAVEENRRSGEHLFVWQGVDRMAQEGI